MCGGTGHKTRRNDSTAHHLTSIIYTYVDTGCHKNARSINRSVSVVSVKAALWNVQECHTMVKFSHTRYRALGPELIPVYMQSARKWLFKSSSGSRLPLLSARPVVTFPDKERHRPLTSSKLYCLVKEAYRCKQVAQNCYAALPRWELNPKPNNCKSNALPIRQCAIQ